jgi:outer membrane receptor protein involved in Fe transport
MNLRAIESLNWIRVFFLIALTLGLATLSLAQGQKGAISGIVTDDSGAVLKGAQVTLESPVFNTVSDEQGRFYINDVAAGNYTLTISYVGFAKFEQSISVPGGQVANVEAKLKLQSQNESILVTAPRVTGEAEAVNIERAADNLVQVLPAEVIRSLPNANMADALGRLPSVTLERDEGEGKYVQVRGLEPRLTNAMIDGVNVPSPESGVRQVKFDAIPADLVESVQVSKTLQPNMEGDGIGGSVNLITKVATNQPTISIGGMGGYTPIIHGRTAQRIVRLEWPRNRRHRADPGRSDTFGRISAVLENRDGRSPVPIFPNAVGARWQYGLQDFRWIEYLHSGVLFGLPQLRGPVSVLAGRQLPECGRFGQSRQRRLRSRPNTHDMHKVRATDIRRGAQKSRHRGLEPHSWRRAQSDDNLVCLGRRRITRLVR